MTLQTAKPIRDLHMNITARAWGEIVHWIQDGNATYDTAYQRGAVWTDEQRIMLIHSIMSGTPIPALIINRRPESMWFGPDGETLPLYAVIDGKQRMMTIKMFMEGDIAVPTSWFDPEDIIETEDTADGAYVRYFGLTHKMQRFFENRPTPVAEASLRTVRREAEVYLRVNSAGTLQTDEDMARATAVRDGAPNRMV